MTEKHIHVIRNNLGEIRFYFLAQGPNFFTLYSNHQATLPDFTVCIASAGCCPVGWRRLKSRCYYLSSEKKNWSESRENCIREESDLVIIDSKEEQLFLNGLGDNLKFWIGLTDSEQEVAWKWVDGTNCAQFKSFVHSPNRPFIESWSDMICSLTNQWVCESTARV
uniref:C-type lectin domain-containing protein n=1 Tax=Esox lucius TaxID=8010 RepID=A0A3P8ZAZ3_ESOLU